MTLAEAVLALLWVGLTAYALFAGADFGAGIWDLLAGGTRRGARQRDLIEHSLGPVWEANHVWLIFVLVVQWTGFPTALVAMLVSLLIGGLLLVPSLVLLYTLFQRPPRAGGEAGDATPTAAGRSS